MSTATDYDARRVSEADAEDKSGLHELGSGLAGSAAAVVDDDPNDAAFFELPGADLSGEELTMQVIPRRADEFMCSCCFLVQHHSRLRSSVGGQEVCADCI